MRCLLDGWCSNVLRSKFESTKEVAEIIRNHFQDLVAWVQPRQVNGFLEAVDGHVQAAKRKALGYTRFSPIRTEIFIIAGKSDFSRINPSIAPAKPTRFSIEPELF